MARPVKSGAEKATVISISCLPEEKDFLNSKGISPSKFFHDSLNNFRKKVNENSTISAVAIIETDIEILRKYYVASVKPDGDKEFYFKAIELFLQKYPDWTKAEVMQRAERPRHVVLEDPKPAEGVESGL